MHETHLSETRVVRGADVFLDNGRDVTRAERVEVELRLDRDGVRLHFPLAALPRGLHQRKRIHRVAPGLVGIVDDGDDAAERWRLTGRAALARRHRAAQ